MTAFVYDAALLERYPTIHAGVAHVTGIANGPSPQALLDEYFSEQAATLQRLSGVSLAEVPHRSCVAEPAYRGWFTQEPGEGGKNLPG